MKYKAVQNGDYPEDGYAIFDELDNCVALTALDIDSFDKHKELAEIIATALTDLDFESK